MSISDQFNELAQPADEAHGGDDMYRLVLRAQEHHQAVRDQMEGIIAMKDKGIKLGDAVQFEAGTDLHKGFLTGLQIALHLIGDFPLKVEESSDSEGE
ncbi:MAG: hypothetical protein ACTID3_18080 [Halomonas sp.]|uniref:hypothetical protein n=1 Tax=Halomonas TaxID=2745 RepID=UPI001867FAA1|nr:hypothetical protein [Halomonas colorata]